MITMNLYGVPVHNCERKLLDFTGDEHRCYYRLRGKPVTQDQAFEIIRRTDRFLGEMDQIYWREEHVGGILFPGWVFSRKRTPSGYSWIHTDGTVGINDYIPITYITMKDILRDWSPVAKAFPYLDMVVAITCWDQFPPDVWEYDLKEEGLFNTIYRTEGPEHDGKFFGAVQVGLHIHDGEIDLLPKEDAVKKYREYAQLYEAEERRKYQANYYDSIAERQDDWQLLVRAIKAYGLEPDEVTRYGRDIVYRGGGQGAV